MSDGSEEAPPTDQSAPWAEALAEARLAAGHAKSASEQAAHEAAEAKTARAVAQEQVSAVTSMKGEAEAAAGWFVHAKQIAEETLASTASALAVLQDGAREATNACKEVQEDRDLVRNLATGAKSRKAALDRLAETAEGYAKAVEDSNATAITHRNAAAETAMRAAALLAEINAHYEAVSAHARQVTETSAQVDAKAAEAKALVEEMAAARTTASRVLAVIEQHESDLARLKADVSALHTRIEGLLPNATSAGLASAFRAQKARFDRPQKGWLWAFIAAIAALMASSLYGLPVTDTSWDAIARHLVNRLPLIAPLVWLAIYAGRHYGLALRLQEEYAYKEAVSTAFEGYKREMSNVSVGTEGGPNPLVTLCENVLRTLSQRPGRIYEGRHDDITVLSPVTDVAKAVADKLMTKETSPPTPG